MHQQQEVCDREVWWWGVAYQLKIWWCRLDVKYPPPPPEVLLQQGAQNDWMPAPDTIDPPSSDTMVLALVAVQIDKTCFPRI